MPSKLAYLASGLFLNAARSTAQTIYSKPCPLLDLEYPTVRSYSSSATVQEAVRKLYSNFGDTDALSAPYGKLDINGTALSIDLYSLRDQDSLFTYYHTPQSLINKHTTGVIEVDANAVQRVGSVSKLWTVYIYLIAAGDKTWNDPITNFVPELELIARNNLAPIKQDSIGNVDWESITIGALASQMAGLPKDAAYSVAFERTVELLGLPAPKRNEDAVCGDDARLKLPCDRKAFFAQYPVQHPFTSPLKTPVYANAPYQILGYALENITGKAMPDLFQEVFVKPLGLNATYYTIPSTENTSFIPGNATTSWWNGDVLDENPAGGYFSSINDMRKIGKAILNSTLLSPAQTRRWMKPHSFTANANLSVGAPWEILRAPGEPISHIYTKSGNIGAYAAMQVLFPDYDVGFSVLAAGESSLETVRILSDILTATFMPAIRAAAKEEAATIYPGTYIDATTNSTMEISSKSDEPGLIVTDWRISNVNILQVLGSINDVDPTTQNLTMHLYPSGLTSNNGTVTSWRAVYQVLPEFLDQGAFSTNCASWLALNLYTFGGVGLDEFLITLDADKSAAVSVQPRFLRRNLDKE